MNITEKINQLKKENIQLRDMISHLIDCHIEQINKVIEDKIIELKDKLREDSINEVCGEEYNLLNHKINNNENYITILSSIANEQEFIDIIKDLIPETTENTPETHETDEDNKTNEVE